MEIVPDEIISFSYSKQLALAGGITVGAGLVEFRGPAESEDFPDFASFFFNPSRSKLATGAMP